MACLFPNQQGLTGARLGWGRPPLSPHPARRVMRVSFFSRFSFSLFLLLRFCFCFFPFRLNERMDWGWGSVRVEQGEPTDHLNTLSEQQQTRSGLDPEQVFSFLPPPPSFRFFFLPPRTSTPKHKEEERSARSVRRSISSASVASDPIHRFVESRRRRLRLDLSQRPISRSRNPGTAAPASH